MYKEEVIHLHQFLLYICRFLEDNGASERYFKDYVSLNISPHHIHKRKIEHKRAALVLSKCISAALAGHSIVPEALPPKFDRLIAKCGERTH